MHLRTLTSDAQPLPTQPLRIVDVSPIHSTIPARPTRASRVVAATRGNIVRLIPGRTRLPLSLEVAPTAAG